VARARANPPIALDGELPDAEHDRLALHNVLEQLDRLREYPAVARAAALGELDLVGMYFDVGAAKVYLYDEKSGSFHSTTVSGSGTVPGNGAVDRMVTP
jgi:carbonic anhydrase